jgi:hypothetical protein
VQKDQLLALGGTWNRGVVDEFEPQVRSGGQQLGDLFGVRLDSLHRLGIAWPVADDVVGQDVHSAGQIGRRPERRPHLRAEHLGG